MNFSLFDLILVLVGVIVGGILVWAVGKRKTTGKAEAIKLWAAEGALIAKMPGAAEEQALLDAKKAEEALAMRNASLTAAKVFGNVPPVV
jgi:hypothetical protein